MRKHCGLSLIVLLLVSSVVTIGQNQQPPAATTAADRIDLPAASRAGGMALTEALAKRRSIRSFAATKLTQQELAQLLWAAQGITDDRGHRTAPSARAQYYLHLYVATADGFFEYIPAGHKLQKLSAKDLRAALSTQQQVASAPAVFVIGGEYERAGQGPYREFGLRFVHLEAGHAAQNLLLQATALGLGAVPVGGFQPEPAMQAASLPPSVNVVYLVPVGHPK